MKQPGGWLLMEMREEALGAPLFLGGVAAKGCLQSLGPPQPGVSYRLKAARHHGPIQGGQAP